MNVRERLHKLRSRVPRPNQDAHGVKKPTVQTIPNGVLDRSDQTCHRYRDGIIARDVYTSVYKLRADHGWGPGRIVSGDNREVRLRDKTNSTIPAYGKKSTAIARQ